MMPANHPCTFCDEPNAPLGYGLSGRRSEKPENKRGYLWVCTDPDCMAQAEQRKGNS